MSGFNNPEGDSFFKDRTVKELYEDVRKTYFANDFPWVIGYSGGKDSTATAQLIWYALSDVPRKQLHKPVFIISSDTLVETPVVIEQIDKTLDQITSAAKKANLPLHTQKVYPLIEDSFWVNLIGKGYPAPSNRFRWCTERLKINPANRFILDTAAELGEVVMVLGARKSESMSRAQVMSRRRQLPGTSLYSHSSLPRAYVYTPLEDFTADDVWTYLDIYECPWGGDNQDLIDLYKKSTSSGECPLVIDTTTPSCGNSRFGCWVCTVVEQDRSMQALIKHGEEWMEPLLDFRDKLAATQVPENKRKYRDFKRRNGQVIVRADGTFIPGPYKFEFRKELIKELLEIQSALRERQNNPSITLINPAELHEIRRLWRVEESDWEDSLPKIYSEVTRESLDWVQTEKGIFSDHEQSLLEEICDQFQIPTKLVSRLIDIERRMDGMNRRSGIFTEIHKLFSEEWGTAEEALERVLSEREQKLNLGIDP